MLGQTPVRIRTSLFQMELNHLAKERVAELGPVDGMPRTPTGIVNSYVRIEEDRKKTIRVEGGEHWSPATEAGQIVDTYQRALLQRRCRFETESAGEGKGDVGKGGWENMWVCDLPVDRGQVTEIMQDFDDNGLVTGQNAAMAVEFMA